MATDHQTYTINTIVLKCDRLGEKYEEYRVGLGQTIKPGMLIERDSVTTYREDDPEGLATVKPHATATGAAVPRIAVESGFLGRPDPTVGRGGTVDDTYAAGEVVRTHLCQPGDIIYGLLATGSNAVPGAKLASNGDGTFRVSTTNPLFEAVDVYNNTSGSAHRLRMRTL